MKVFRARIRFRLAVWKHSAEVDILLRVIGLSTLRPAQSATSLPYMNPQTHGNGVDAIFRVKLSVSPSLGLLYSGRALREITYPGADVQYITHAGRSRKARLPRLLMGPSLPIAAQASRRPNPASDRLDNSRQAVFNKPRLNKTCHGYPWIVQRIVDQ